ncbi:hypothetical protein SDC9_198079 [bioreactor metagenome]|uniref:Uncharacterized protein n=1 Tax=bioreactor metagenome TaxID=1076179 RepID=A0A645IHZ2_9ZZZZ
MDFARSGNTPQSMKRPAAGRSGPQTSLPGKSRPQVKLSRSLFQSFSFCPAILPRAKEPGKGQRLRNGLRQADQRVVIELRIDQALNRPRTRDDRADARQYKQRQKKLEPAGRLLQDQLAERIQRQRQQRATDQLKRNGQLYRQRIRRLHNLGEQGVLREMAEIVADKHE